MHSLRLLICPDAGGAGVLCAGQGHVRLLAERTLQTGLPGAAPPLLPAGETHAGHQTLVFLCLITSRQVYPIVPKLDQITLISDLKGLRFVLPFCHVFGSFDIILREL